jgi:hypothetical protein
MGKYDKVATHRLWRIGIGIVIERISGGKFILNCRYKQVYQHCNNHRLYPLLTPLLVNLILVDEIMDFGLAAIFATVVVVFFFISGTAADGFIAINIYVTNRTFVLTVMDIIAAPA